MVGLVNWAVVDAMWVSIYVLGALAFTSPEKYSGVAPFVFWAVFAWSLISTPVWVIGNWMGFYVNMGVYEEHEIEGVNHSIFLSVRVLPALMVSLLSAGVVGGFLALSVGVNPFGEVDPVLLALSLSVLMVMSVLYSLVIAYAGLALSTPAPLLDIMNFFLFVAGGIAVPVADLPQPLRILAISTPYSHPAEIMRYSVDQEYTPFFGFDGEAFASLFFLVFLVLLVRVVEKWSRGKVLREGLRGIGRM